jgi:hypothetical protein
VKGEPRPKASAKTVAATCAGRSRPARATRTAQASWSDRLPAQVTGFDIVAVDLEPVGAEAGGNRLRLRRVLGGMNQADRGRSNGDGCDRGPG